MKSEQPANNVPAGRERNAQAFAAMPHSMKSFWSNVGSCPTCMSVSAAFLALSLLVFGLGTTIEEPIVAMVGELASVAFGILVGLHAIFYFARKKELIAQPPAGRSPVFTVSNRGGGCCGGRP
jgi:hypothetical protein